MKLKIILHIASMLHCFANGTSLKAIYIAQIKEQMTCFCFYNILVSQHSLTITVTARYFPEIH